MERQRRENSHHTKPCNLLKIYKTTNEIFKNLVNAMYKELEGFGEICAIDGKIINCYSNPFNQSKKKDRRSDKEATRTAKTYTDKNGKKTKPKYYYGYRTHILCDSTYELPIAFKVTPANKGEVPIAKELLFNEPENINYKK